MLSYLEQLQLSIDRDVFGAVGGADAAILRAEEEGDDRVAGQELANLAARMGAPVHLIEGGYVPSVAATATAAAGDGDVPATYGASASALALSSSSSSSAASPVFDMEENYRRRDGSIGSLSDLLDPRHIPIPSAGAGLVEKTDDVDHDPLALLGYVSAAVHAKAASGA